MRFPAPLLAALLAACASAPPVRPEPPIAPAEVKPPPPEPSAVAREIAGELTRREFEKVTDRFESASLMPSALQRQWDAVAGELGVSTEITVLREEARTEGRKTFTVECTYEKGGITVQLTLTSNLRISGLRLAPPAPRDVIEHTAREWLDLTSGSSWTKAVARLDPEMTRLVSAEKLAEVFEAFRADAGPLLHVYEAHVDWFPRGATVDFECGFEKKNAVVRVALDRRLRVSGFFFKPGWEPPPYADTGAFEEREVQVGTDKFPLPATLSMPKGKGPFRAVVLVHGSGPADRDESIGPNKIFKDLAWGLASRGTAVLRYVKRTEQYRGKLSPRDVATVKEESIDDAISAVRLLWQTPGIDPERIFVAGHSLGAKLAPRIAATDPRVRGIVLLAGSTRPYGKLVLDQAKYLAGVSEASEEDRKKWVWQAEVQGARMDAPDLRPDELVDGTPGEYWIDLRDHAGVKIAPRLNVPMLVMQGARDYQVTVEDFDGWKKALKGRPYVTFKLYPELNHHFMPGTGPSTPEEYQVPNHVPKQVVEDVSGWLKKQ